MTEPFTLTAIPGLLAEGQDKGHLEFVTFVAENRIITAKWTAVNVGTFIEDFSRIQPREDATDIVSKLKAGTKVLFPGFWHIEEIKQKFGGCGND
jgi:hypothetical protein